MLQPWPVVGYCCGTLFLLLNRVVLLQFFLDHVLLYCLFDMNLSRLLKHVLLFHL